MFVFLFEITIQILVKNWSCNYWLTFTPKAFAASSIEKT